MNRAQALELIAVIFALVGFVLAPLWAKSIMVAVLVGVMAQVLDRSDS